MRSLKFLFFLFVFFPLQAGATLVVSNWNETTQLTDEGKKSVIGIEAQVKDIPKDQAMTAFSISFDAKQKISISNVSFEGKLVKYEFNDNVLKIAFPQSKLNGQLVSFKFSYEEKYEKVNQYLRQEPIYVPDFAAGAFASIFINFTGYDLTTYNPRAIRDGNSLTYTAVVPKEGIKESVKFTPLKAMWDVVIKTAITSEKPLGEFSVKIPSYFQGNRQKVENYSNNFSSSPIFTDRKGDDISYSFRVPTNKFEIKSKARITTGAGFRRQVMRNMINYTRVTPEESALLAPMLKEIRSDSKYAGLPTYVAIGEFVHRFIKYDKSYVGKLPSLQEIVKNGIGVCTEYAKLYDGLARLAGIPSVIINGAACGEYDECQGHSWNMIFYNSQWIEVDPTWDLMSGIVSTSHVYINDEGKGEIEIKYYSNAGKVGMEMDLEMGKVSN